jgi:hypothetical protein
MPTFIKTGFWESSVKSYKGWLNLEDLISGITISGSGTAGQVAFWTNTNVQSGSNKLVWDVVNSSLLINNSTYDGYSNLINTGKSLFNNSGSTISTSHLGYGASTIIASSAQSPLRILRPVGQPNIFIGTNSQVPASTNFLFGIRTGAWFNTTTPTYSGDYAAMVVEKYLGGSGWGASVNVANLRMFTYFTCNGNNSRRALMIYPLAVETATNTDVVYVNNLYIASAGYFGSTVNARLHIRGDGTTTATNSIYIDNDLGTKLLSLSDDGQMLVGTGSYAGYRLDVNGTARVSGNTTFLGTIAGSNAGRFVIAGGNFAVNITSNNPTNGEGSLITTGAITTTDNQTKNIINVNNAVTSTSASFNTLNGFAFTSTINQTLGIIRGLYINPTLTAATNFRAIETERGNVVFKNLPTSSAGLPSGAIWNDAGTVKIIP